MFIGFGYACVPLYRIFCAATGYGGTVKSLHNVDSSTITDRIRSGEKGQREMTIFFTATAAENMPWSFTPLQPQIRVKVGDTALAFFSATNHLNRAVTGVATYNIAPMKAALYFNKIQCFCFEEQQLQPKETIDMPVFFYIDPEMERDPALAEVDELTLSYTFFPTEEARDEDYLDDDEDVAAAATAAATTIANGTSSATPSKST